MSFKEQYKRLKVLGRGAFGECCLVQQRSRPGLLHAAKEIRLSNLSKEEKNNALAEAELLKQVSHPSIVAYVTMFLEDTRLYIVMEYADGGDLAEKIKRQKELA